MLDYILPHVAKLSRTLQTEQLDLLMISSLVNATLHTLDDSVLPSANCVLQLLDDREQLFASQLSVWCITCNKSVISDSHVSAIC